MFINEYLYYTNYDLNDKLKCFVINKNNLNKNYDNAELYRN